MNDYNSTSNVSLQPLSTQVFVNNRLVVDMGGIHQPLSIKSVLLTAAAGAAFNGMVLFQDYALDIFTAERHTRGKGFVLNGT